MLPIFWCAGNFRCEQAAFQKVEQLNERNLVQHVILRLRGAT